MFLCGVSDEYNGSDKAGLCKWPNDYIIKVSLRQYVPGPDAETQSQIHQAAWRAWASVSGVQHVFVGASEFANVRILAVDLGGPRGVLARATLPCNGVGPTVSLWQEYDSTEDWSDEISPVLGKIDLLAVAVHETGHSLGISHGPSGNIMAPSYTGDRALGDWDRAESQLRYGPPGPAVPDLTLISVLQSARRFLDDLIKSA